jgi:hypothetical protein
MIDHVAPHAIAWRPIQYFGTHCLEGQDELDSFVGFSFTYGNQFRFDIRRYMGHPANTSSFYFAVDESSTQTILDHLRKSFEAVAVPKSAISWKRNESFQYGVLNRKKEDRLREEEARILCLKIAYSSPNHTASTELIKRRVADFYEFSEKDLEESKTRRNEALWQQIIGNVISHRDASTGPFETGYAIRTSDGLRLTAAGIRFLHCIGFY